MPRTPNLFLLVHSLTGSEKRYVQLRLSGRKKDSNILKLFNIIARQIEYDEEAIKQQFKGKKFVSQLHVTKASLTEGILRSLRNFHSNGSSHSQLLALLGDIELLFHKELYDLCQQKIHKAARLAERYEQFPLLMQVYTWNRRLQMARQGSTELADVLRGEEETLQRMHNIRKYWESLSARIPADSTGDLPAGSSNDSVQEHVLRSHILFMRNVVNQKSAEADAVLQELIGFLEGHPDRMREDPGPLATVLSNRIGLLLFEKRFDEIPPLVQHIRGIPQKFGIRVENRFTARVRLRLFNVELELYRDTKQLAKGIALIGEIQEFLKAYRSSVPDDYRVLLHYQFAYLFFLTEEYSQSLHWINEVINERTDARMDVQTFARFLGLIVHFELGNIIVLRYAVDSCRRFLKKKKALQQYESIVLGLFSKLSLALPEEYPPILRRGYKQLFDTTNVLVSAEVLDYVDIKGWLEGKRAHLLTNATVPEVTDS